MLCTLLAPHLARFYPPHGGSPVGTNSTLLRYGHQQIKECKDFEKTYNCIQGCLSRDYQIAKADKDCRCFCLKDATKAKYFDQISVTKRAPTTTIPGKFVSTTTTIKYDENNYDIEEDPEDLVQVVSEKVPQPIENGSISNETTNDGNSTVESTTDGNYIEDTTSDGYYIDESTSDANYNVETTMEE
ncbi:hypothetical protein SFRURICE_020856 [Spodoptera frugiperda]|nr:hypothetical protein SFRURICE_020856 [Spodoptera frugiperda]